MTNVHAQSFRLTPIPAVVILLFSACLLFSQSITSTLYPTKDGEADQISQAGDKEDIEICGISDSKVVSWITFNTTFTDLKTMQRATLQLSLNGVMEKGTLKIYALTEEIGDNENNISFSSVRYNGQKPVSTVIIAPQQSKKLVALDVTAALKSSPFYGFALASDDGLLATVCSKEGTSKPVLFLEYSLLSLATDNTISWMSLNNTKLTPIKMDSIATITSMTLNNIQNPKPNAFAEAIAVFHPTHASLSIKGYAALSFNGYIPEGHKIVVKILQSTTNQSVTYGYEVTGQGTKDTIYAIPLSDFKSRPSTPEYLPDLDHVWAISFANENPGIVIVMTVNNIRFSGHVPIAK